jgi:hypothetical protein
VRFLVGQRGQQAPVDAGQVLCRLEMAAPGGELAARVVEEAGDAFGIDALDVAEVAVMQARQRTVGAGGGDEGVGLGAQAVGILAAEGPAEFQLARQLQQRRQLGWKLTPRSRWISCTATSSALCSATRASISISLTPGTSTTAAAISRPVRAGYRPKANRPALRRSCRPRSESAFRAEHVVVTDDPLRHGANRRRILQQAVAQRHRGRQMHPAGQRQVVEFIGHRRP